MKTRNILVALMISLSGSFAVASAQNTNFKESADITNQQAKIGIDKNNFITVTYPYKIDEDRRKLVVRVYDDSGYLIYRRQFRKKDKVKVRYDISQFPDGNYNFGIYNKYELVCSKDIAVETKIETKINTKIFLVQN